MSRRLRLSLLGLVLVAAVSAVAPTPAGAVTNVSVTTTADVAVSIRFTSLREALTTAAGTTGDVLVSLQPGATYTLTLCGPSEDGGASGDLDVRGTPGSVVIDGNGATIVQTCPGERVLHHLLPGRLTLREVRLTGGDSTGDGGAVLSSSSLFLAKATIAGNEAAGDGGGVRATSLDVLDSEIRDNHAAGDGGGLLAEGPGIPPPVITLDRVHVHDNTAGGVGGGVLLGGAVIVDRTTVNANTAGSTGGAVIPFGTIQRSTIADNVEDGGSSPAAAVEVEAGTNLTLRASTIRGGSGDGGALRATALTATSSAVAAGGAGSACGTGSDATVAGDEGNADNDDSCHFDGAGDRPGIALGLGAAVAENGGPTPTIRPASSSALAEAGVCGTLTIDQRGVSRPQGLDCDTGAVELKRRADALVGSASSARFVGNDVYQPSGLGQAINLSTPVNQPVEFVFRAQNDSEVRDVLRIHGPATTANHTFRYFRGRTDVTAAVVNGAHGTAPLGPGQAEDLTVRVTPRSLFAGTRHVLLRVTSSVVGVEIDGAKAIVAVRR